MKELTIDYLKQIGPRYSLSNSLVMNTNAHNQMSQGKQLRLLVQSIVTFSSDEQLKKFLNNELLNLTKTDLLDIFGWKKPNLGELSSALSSLFWNNSLNFSNVEIQFIYLMLWRLYNESFKAPTRKTDCISIVGLIKSQTINDTSLRKKIALALLEIDYLDYFNPEDYKKELFEITIGI